MTKPRRIPDSVWRWIKILDRQLVRNYQGDARMSHLVLLLTTTGRKSGLLRTTPLQYEEIDGVYYVASARGRQADWFRNLQANPCVHVQVQELQFDALAEPILDPARIADFLEYRLDRHPRMMGAMLRTEGLPAGFSRSQLEQFAAEKALVALRPEAAYFARDVCGSKPSSSSS